jgi:UDP-N-acetylmuramoyl-L-alanyl-D-glutamate--2,6-diaminopimelate ligase
MLEAHGKKVGMITTVAISIAGQRTLNTSKMTTLKASELQRYLSACVNAGCEYAIVETTSHALDQNRVAGIYYDVVAITNITHDHLDYHKTMEAYQKAKEKLFANQPQVSVVNADIAEAKDFLRYDATQKLTFGIVDQLRPKEALPHPSIAASLLKLSPDDTRFTLTTPVGESEAMIPLPGRFTVSNVLCAVAIALSQSVPLSRIVATLRELKAVEGRLEPVEAGQPFSILVDFAHTPDALKQVYDTLRPMVRGKLIAVLGATGRRDTTKRPLLGALAGQYADLVIVTNEDPYDEDPKSIINAVADGVPKGRPSEAGSTNGEGQWWWKILDRREAIAKAIGMAEKGDAVIITGKGGEHVMAVGDKLIPYNDVKVVKETLARVR